MEGFAKVKSQITYLINAILERTLETNLLQRVVEISAEKQARIVLIRLQSLEMQSEDVESYFPQFKTIMLDVNEILTHTLVWTQKLEAQELVDQEQIVGNHLLKLQEQEEAAKKQIQNLKKEQDRLTMENQQSWDDRAWLEKVVFVAFYEFLVIAEDMDVETKAQNIGDMISGFKCDLEYLEALVNL